MLQRQIFHSTIKCAKSVIGTVNFQTVTISDVTTERQCITLDKRREKFPREGWKWGRCLSGRVRGVRTRDGEDICHSGGVLKYRVRKKEEAENRRKSRHESPELNFQRLLTFGCNDNFFSFSILGERTATSAPEYFFPSAFLLASRPLAYLLSSSLLGGWKKIADEASVDLFFSQLFYSTETIFDDCS